MAESDIALFQFAPCFGVPNASPFCLKVETFLRLSDLSYETKEIQNPRTAPKRKLPFIEHGKRRVSDSTLILDYLRKTFPEETSLVPVMNSACEYAIKIMLEEHLLWIGLRYRWLDPELWPKVKEAFFGGMPSLPRKFVPELVRLKMKRDLQGQGMGRFSEEELVNLAKRDMNALAEFLSDRKFFCGDKPGELDCSAYGMLANIYHVPSGREFEEFADTLSNLKDYTQRMSEKVFPDF